MKEKNHFSIARQGSNGLDCGILILWDIRKLTGRSSEHKIGLALNEKLHKTTSEGPT